MNEAFASTGRLVRLNLRRERIIAPATIVILVATNSATIASIRKLYGTADERATLFGGAASNAAFKLLLGPLEHLQSTASIASWRAGLFMIAATAVCSVLMVTRLTRKEEELGRVELIRAARTGRIAVMTAALIVATGFAFIVAVAMAALMMSAQATATEAAVVGGQYFSTSLAGIGLAALTTQAATTARLANLLAVFTVLGGYLLRGIADAAGWTWLRWTNPVGWAQEMDPFGANNPMPALLSVTFFIVAVGAAIWVNGHRDLGSGLIAPRPGPPSSRIASIGGLTARLNRGGFLGWLVGVAVFGVFIGVMVNAANSIVGDNQQMADYLHKLGGPGELTKVFLAVIMTYLGFTAAAWAVSVMSRVHGDESAGRTEVVLATPVSRASYFGSQLVLVIGGIVVMLLVAGLFVGIGAGAVTGQWSTMLVDSVRGAAVQIPAALVIGVGVMALYGLAPKLVVGGGWVMVVGAFLLGPMGELFGVPQWARDISPFTHLPAVPSAAMAWTPIVILLVVVVVLAAGGWWRFRARDIEGR